jgi:hypothetical protein
LTYRDEERVADRLIKKLQKKLKKPLTNSKICDIINTQDKESVLNETTHSPIRSPCKAIECKGRADNFGLCGKVDNQSTYNLIWLDSPKLSHY